MHKNLQSIHYMSLSRNCFLFAGNPQPKYKWFKDGVPLSNELTSEPYFRIQSTRREDAGVYHCVATNDVGSIFSERITFAVACTYKLSVTPVVLV